MSFPKKTIYLAGPIAGLTHDDARYGWREDFAAELRDAHDAEHIHCASPMRAKEFLRPVGVIGTGNLDAQRANQMATAAGITTRDFNDVATSDLMVACFLEAAPGSTSLGTAWEIGACYALQKPVIMVAAPDDPHRLHPILERSSGYIVETLDEAAHLAYHLLTPSI